MFELKIRFHIILNKKVFYKFAFAADIHATVTLCKRLTFRVFNTLGEEREGEAGQKGTDWKREARKTTAEGGGEEKKAGSARVSLDMRWTANCMIHKINKL